LGTEAGLNAAPVGATASTVLLASKLWLRCRPRGVCAPPGHLLMSARRP